MAKSVLRAVIVFGWLTVMAKNYIKPTGEKRRACLIALFTSDEIK